MSDVGKRGGVPVWVTILAIVLILWGAMGCYAWFLQSTEGADAWGEASGYDRALYASLPDWYDWVYAVAVFSGFLGGIALLMRSKLAQTFFLASLIAVLVQFGYLFATTDIIAAKGMGTIGFPIFVTLVAAFSVWFAGLANAKGWVR